MFKKFIFYLIWLSNLLANSSHASVFSDTTHSISVAYSNPIGSIFGVNKLMFMPFLVF